MNTRATVAELDQERERREKLTEVMAKLDAAGAALNEAARVACKQRSHTLSGIEAAIAVLSVAQKHLRWELS